MISFIGPLEMLEKLSLHNLFHTICIYNRPNSYINECFVDILNLSDPKSFGFLKTMRVPYIRT